MSIEKIENAVQTRKLGQAKTLLKKWLKSSPGLASRLLACDWYRRLGEFKEAYRTIAPDHFHFNRTHLSTLENKQYVWSARMLNLMGASHFALEIIKRLPPSAGAEENRVIANIYFTNFDSAAALVFFQRAEALDSQPESYSARMGQVSAADALAGVGKTTAAIRRLKKIKTLPGEDLIRGIILQAEGEYLAKTGDYEQALSVLAKASPFFSENDQSPDRLFLLKWQGIAKLGAGKIKEGVKDLANATRALRRPEYRAEIWLDCWYWKAHLGQATKKERDLLQDYPGLPQGFVQRYAGIPNRKIIANGAPAKTILISFARQEWKMGENYFHSLPKEIELLGYLRRSYPYGLNLVRLATLLWPDEVNSFLHLEGRIHQLLRRLRQRHGIMTKTKNSEVLLDAASAQTVSVEVRLEKSVPFVFEKRTEVSFAEIQAFYSLQRTQAHHLVKEWIKQKRVRSAKVGRRVIFTVSSLLRGTAPNAAPRV
jgi:tetratricopeptide (TPR) repeat protein